MMSILKIQRKNEYHKLIQGMIREQTKWEKQMQRNWKKLKIF